MRVRVRKQQLSNLTLIPLAKIALNNEIDGGESTFLAVVFQLFGHTTIFLCEVHEADSIKEHSSERFQLPMCRRFWMLRRHTFATTLEFSVCTWCFHNIVWRKSSSSHTNSKQHVLARSTYTFLTMHNQQKTYITRPKFRILYSFPPNVRRTVCCDSEWFAEERSTSN